MIAKLVLRLLDRILRMMWSIWRANRRSFSGEALASAAPTAAMAAEAAEIKGRLPVVDCIGLAVRKKQRDAFFFCAVCLQLLEARDPVRDLANCPHAFHVCCLDRWLDLGRFTCPLCRSALFPPEPPRRFLSRLIPA